VPVQVFFDKEGKKVHHHMGYHGGGGYSETSLRKWAPFRACWIIHHIAQPHHQVTLLSEKIFQENEINFLD
jgi:hypothetical protein